MGLELYVDGERWRSHLRSVASTEPDLIPVAKGNGYGFGLASLARRSGWLGCGMVAVGTYREVLEVEKRFTAEILVLEPWRPWHSAVVPNRLSERLVHTIGRSDDLADLASRVARPRVVLEGRTSMGRSGMPPEELTALDAAARRWSGDDRVRVLGHALHLPLGEGHQAEVDGWLAAAPATTWFVSHLTAAELDELRRKHPGVTFRPRIGTRLWLGDAAALHPKATVVDARPVSRGERVGYRQQRLRRSGTVLVVSGGTSHGIGLEAPRAITSSRQRARALVRGGLESAGMALSPFTIAGRQRWFVEPPHMQVSLVFLPDDVTPPRPGDQLDVAVRYTTTIFDAVHLS